MKRVTWNQYVEVVLMLEAEFADRHEISDTEIIARDEDHRSAMKRLEKEGVDMTRSWYKDEVDVNGL